MRLLLVVTFSIFASGCFFGFISMPTRNAPGNIDVAAPPSHPESRVPEEPKDPGTQIVLFALRGVVSGGIAAGAGRDVRWSYANGGEASLSYGLDVNPKSLWGASRDSALLLAVPDRGLARRSIGLNLGWLPDLESNQPSRVYAELEINRQPLGLGVGYVWEPSGVGRGFQATVNAMLVFARATYLSQRGTSVVLGLDVAGLTTGAAWSR